MSTSLIDDLKQAFINWKSKKIPTYVNKTFSEAEEQAFVRAAEFCDSLEADPFVYVRSQVEEQEQIKFPVNFLCTKYSKDKYEKYISEIVTEVPIEALFHVQLRYLQDAIREGRPVEDVLMDDNIQFYPWFRIAITVDAVPKILEKYRQQAGIMLTQEIREFLRSQKLNPRV